MHGPIIMSNLNPNQKRHSHAPNQPLDHIAVDENLDAVHEYKKCMEEIKREHPELHTGAMQKMALERCAMMHADQQRMGGGQKKRFSEPAEMIRGMMSKFRIGNKHQQNCKSHGVGEGCENGAVESIPCVGEDDIGETISSHLDHLESTHSSGGGRSGGGVESELGPGKRSSLAIRSRSVATINSDDRRLAISQLSSDGSSLDDESLQDSLDNIERTVNVCFDKSKSRPKAFRIESKRRCSRRISGLSLELSDVEEDEDQESKSSKEGEGGDADKRGSSLTGSSSLSLLKSKSSIQSPMPSKQSKLSMLSKTSKFEQSVSDILPDEIKVVLDGFKKENGIKTATTNEQSQRDLNPGKTPNGKQQKQNKLLNSWGNSSEGGLATSQSNESKQSQSSSKAKSRNESMMSSFLSVDSADFKGDFSAWRRSSDDLAR